MLAGAPLAWMGVLVALPVVFVLVLAFAEVADRLPPIAPLLVIRDGIPHANLTLSHLLGVLGDPLYRVAFGQAAAYAVATTLLCILVGYPIAYAIAMAPARRRPIYLLLAIVPFWTSFLMRTYAWMGLIRDTGPLNRMLIHLGILEHPTHLLYAPSGVLLVMVYSYLPFFIMPMYSVLERLPRDLLEAACDLGASPGHRFWTVTLPLSRPGLLAGSALVFVPAMGEYIIPDLVGNTRTMPIGGVLWSELFQNQDWPTAASIALLTSLAIGLPLLAIRHALRGRAPA